MSEQLNLFDNLGIYEGVDVEYKSAKGGLPSDLWETYSAFANTGGGTIWLGIAQRRGELDIHGLDDPERLVSDFWNTLNNRNKVSCNLLGNEQVSILTVPVEGVERRVICIQVPRADRRQRPVFLGIDPFKGTFRRNYEGDYRCLEPDVRRMFADQAEEPADARILDGFTLDDLHPESLRQFRQVFVSRGQHVWQSEDDLGLLTKLGGWRRDRQSGKEGLTVAGLLMFGKAEAIRDASGVPGFQLDYRERFSDDPALRWTNRLTLDGTWEGNLFHFYQRVMQSLSVGPGIKRPFQTNAEGYRVTLTPVVEALQESLVNALVHADYSGQGGIVIDRWQDRLEFSNPGNLLVSREQLMNGGISECRNKSLQLMFQMLGAADKAGSGIDKIRAGWASEHWRSPSLRETHQPDRVVLLLPMVSTLPAETLELLQKRFGDRFTSLSSDEVQTVVTAEVEGEVTNQRMQEMLTLHRVDITRLLRGLVQDGFLRTEGVGRGTRYKPILPEAPPRDLGNSPPDLGSSPPDLGASPPVSSPEMDFPPELLAIAAAIRSSGKASAEQVRETILRLCHDRFLSLRELSQLLDRSLETLREGYVSPMAREGLLIPRYPETPSHRGQAYRSAACPPKDIE